MGKLTIIGGAHKIEKDISGKNLLNEILMAIPKENLPAEFSYSDLEIKIGNQLIDINTFDIDRAFIEDVEIVLNPKGIGLIIGIISLVLTVASIVLAPKLPSQQQQTDSPNNSFFGQTNVIRLDDLEPNIYGTQTSYPDLIVGEGGAWSYINNKKIVDEVFLIGIGSYETSEPKFEQTPFSSIDGQSYNYYQQGQTVPVVQGQFNSEFIDGQVLLGPNNSETSGGLTADSLTADIFVDAISDYVNIVVPITPAWTAIFNVVGGQFGKRFPITFEYGVATGVDLACTFFDAFATGDIYNMAVDSPGFYGMDISSSDAVNSDCDGVQNYDGTLTLNLLPAESEIVVIMPIKTDEVQVSFEFLRGLKGAVELAVYVSDTTAQFGESRTNFTYSSNTINQRFYSEKIATTPPVSSDLTVRIVRYNDDRLDGQDTVQVSQVATNSYRNNVNYGDRTILKTSRKATSQAVSLRDSKVNAVVTRKTVTYSDGVVVPTLTASRSFADAILHEYTEVYDLNASDLPLEELYQIDASLSDGLNFFDYTFADKEQNIKTSLDVIANVARCSITYTGQGYEIYRDEASTVSAQFDSRNISMNSPEEVSYRGAVETSNNGIKLKWKNPDSNKYEYVNYTLINGVSTKCVYQDNGLYLPTLPTIPLDIDLTGSTTLEQAEDRADLECRKLIFIQKTLRTTVLKDGQEAARGQIVRHSDYWQNDVTSGEIAAINGDIYTTYNEIDLVSGTYYVTYNNELGETSSPIPCTILDLNNFQSVLPEAYLADGYSIQSGSRYIISTLTEHENNLYTVNDKESNEDGTVTLELVQYDERIYPEED